MEKKPKWPLMDEYGNLTMIDLSPDPADALRRGQARMKEALSLYRLAVVVLVFFLALLAYSYNKDTSLAAFERQLRELGSSLEPRTVSIAKNLESDGYYYVIPLWKDPDDAEWRRVAELLRERGYLVFRDRVDAEIELDLRPGTLVNPALRRLREVERLPELLEPLKPPQEKASQPKLN